VRRAPAAAKLNLALVVGPLRPDGKHELCTILQRIDLADRIELEAAPRLMVRGFEGETLVTRALELLAVEAGVEPHWEARLTKNVPVASGLGGGSSDAATALRLANETLDRPVAPARLLAIARSVGSDVPFFFTPGPQLGTGDGSELAPLELPQDYWVVVVMPNDARKASTADVYAAFDARDAANGFEERRARVDELLPNLRRARDLAQLPPNELSSSPLADELLELGAFRADVTGAGPAVYGLFHRRSDAEAARSRIRSRGRTWLTVPAWYF
jgi:4-diphosphocytidyl-2-C-methyl-D-erythritol kinase